MITKIQAEVNANVAESNEAYNEYSRTITIGVEVPDPPVIETITQPTCASSTGSVVLNGLPTTGTWTITRTPGGNTQLGTGTSATKTGLVPGEYTFKVTSSLGAVSSSSEAVTINPQPVRPGQPDPIVGANPVCPSSAYTYNIEPVLGTASNH